MTTILTINAGSSSIKFATFANEHEELRRVISGRIERIGLPEARFTWKDHSTGTQGASPIVASDHRSAMGTVLERLGRQEVIAAIGHRIVHGGDEYSEAVRIDGEVLESLARLEPLAPEHMPAELAIVRLLAEIMPHVPQVACFDTAFHQSIPAVARLIPVPREWEARGVRRYGFHGLSYEFVVEHLRQEAPHQSEGRLIIAHLGNGASMAAVRNGKCIDTSMAFSPCAGLVMGTRTGDLDPGVAWYMMKGGGLDADAFFEIANHRSGLLGVSDLSSDMRDLLEARATNEQASDAVTLFCYTARKWIGAFTAALGGLDLLVFTGGIGENSAIIREEICRGLDCIDLRLDKSHNEKNAAVISSDESRVVVRVVKTDEEQMIARKTAALLE